MVDTKKKADENELQYIWRIGCLKDYGLFEGTWDDVAEVLNQNLRDEDEYWTSSAYRKKFQQAKSFYDEVFSKMVSEEYSDEIKENKRELARLKTQYRDERNAWNKQNTLDARMIQKLDYLEECLKTIGREEFESISPIRIESDNDLLVIVSDLHIGQTFNNIFGKYNSDIAKDRLLNQYLPEIIKIKKLYDSENAYVSLQGDLISGSIHKSIQVTNRENVIEQIKIAASLISTFCSELSKYFQNVYVTNISGNHSRLDTKDDSLHDERLDDLIGWIVKSTLSHIENIKFNDVLTDIGIGIIKIRNKSYVSVHGDYDSYNKTGVSNLSTMLGFIPDAVLFGHLHTSSVTEENGIKLIRGGSLAGCGDAYTVEKRLKGKPSQMVCVCNNKGIESYHIIEMD